ncbi:MAG TPA: contractile injection system tape measure protein, partial [Segetibacter sp.]|nr:contractile injection system tape measure protein [Segetibacter sp.]
MFITNTINRQIFDFTCPSEIIATKVQNEIAHNTGTSLNDIVDEVLTESLSGVELLIIDKLEIDLSDIKVEDFGNREMSDSFKEKLQAKIASLVNVPPRVPNEHLLSIADACLDANIAFLTTGYFPWWVDGILEINADEMLQSIVRERPQVLKKFIIANRNESAVMSRLQQQYKPSTKAAINTLVPDLFKKYNKKKIASEIDFFTTHIFEEAEPEIYLDELVTETLEKLCHVAEKPARLIKVHK